MARVTVRNLGDVYRNNPNLGQLIDDLITHISDLKQQLTTQQQTITALQKQVNPK